MTQKKKPPSKAKPRKSKKSKGTSLDKAMRSLPSAASDFQKVVKGEPGYTRI